MKKWLRLGVVLALGASGGWAVDWKARYPKPEGYVSDFAQVIDAASRSQLEAYAASVQQATGAQMALRHHPLARRRTHRRRRQHHFSRLGSRPKGQG